MLMKSSCKPETTNILWLLHMLQPASVLQRRGRQCYWRRAQRGKGVAVREGFLKEVATEP